MFVKALLSNLPVEPYDLEVARSHALLLAHSRRSGRARGAHGLLIAATALTAGRTVVTANATGFDDLPGVSLRTLPETA